MDKIVCIGPMWRGSDAGGLFRAFSRQGIQISVVDEFYYIPLRSKGMIARIFSRISRYWFVIEYNNEILKEVKCFSPDLVWVYKGAFVLPETLKEIKQKGILLINFYPDVSFHTHGKHIKNLLPLYDHIFTTKSFGINDLEDQFGIKNTSFIPHGFDPEIHKKLVETENKNNLFQCDVSFIGAWSPKKEKFMAALVFAMPHVIIKIWGSRWEKATSSNLIQSNCIQGYPILGDGYRQAINSSLINLGILLEQVRGASSGDQITSRTFHIPASGGFMLHERTSEVANYFIENEEIACFEGEEELIEKTKYYLENSAKRNLIKENGYLRATNENSLDHRVQSLLKIINEKL